MYVKLCNVLMFKWIVVEAAEVSATGVVDDAKQSW